MSKLVIKAYEHRVKESTDYTTYSIISAFGKYEDADGHSGTLYDASTLVTTREFSSADELIQFVYRKLKMNPNNCTVNSLDRDEGESYISLEVVYKTRSTTQSYLLRIAGYKRIACPKDELVDAFKPILYKEG